MTPLVLRCCAGLLAVLLMFGGAIARAEQDSVGFSLPDVWPWAYESEEGDQQGSLVELVNRLSEVSGIPVRIKLRPLRRVIMEITNGEAGFTVLFSSPALDEQAVPVGKVIDVNLLLLARADTDHPLEMRALEGSRVAYIRGTYLGEAFEYNQDVIKVPVSSVSQAIELLKMGRVSAILASDHNILRSIQKQGLRFRDFRYRQHVAGQRATMYRSVKGSDAVHGEKFERALAEMARKGELRQLFFGHSEPVSPAALFSAH